MKTLVGWLDESWLSQILQANLWVIPLIQSIHILALAVMIGSAFVLLLRVVGLANRWEPATTTVDRCLPRMWTSLTIMAISGSLLVIAEPDRSLRNPAFWAKMALVASSVAVTLALGRAVRQQPSSSDNMKANGTSRLAAFGFLLWCAVIVAGRWIAYIDVN